MKNTNIIAIITIVILTLGFAGCSTRVHGNIEHQNISVYEYANLENHSTHMRPSPLEISRIEGKTFKDEILRHINAAKKAKEGDENYYTYMWFEIPDIKFYYPNIIIDGYEMYRVSISRGLSYSYVPIEELDKKNHTSVISMDMRPSATTPFHPQKIITQLNRDNLTDEHFYYDNNMDFITAQIDDTIFSVMVWNAIPNELNSYEFLRELCIQVMETVELVIVNDCDCGTCIDCDPCGNDRHIFPGCGTFCRRACGAKSAKCETCEKCKPVTTITTPPTTITTLPITTTTPLTTLPTITTPTEFNLMPTTTTPPPQIQIKLGHILGNPNISIFDALEILKYITGMESVIDTCENARAAALIVSSDVPGIFDVLEILKALAGMESAVSG